MNITRGGVVTAVNSADDIDRAVKSADRNLRARLEAAVSVRLDGPCAFIGWRVDETGASLPRFAVRAGDVRRAIDLGFRSWQFVDAASVRVDVGDIG